MAGAKPGVHALQLKPIDVPEALVEGGKFLKWDDGSTMGVPVTLRVDPKGYILYWRDQNKDMDCLEISLIRDTRTGKYAKLPKDPKLQDSLSIGQQDQSLEEKTISICHGTDFVNVEFLNFICSSAEVAKLWCDELLKYSKNLLSLNGGVLSFLEKAFTKAVTMVSPSGKAPVKNVIKMVAQHRDDRRRVEKALEAAHIPSGKNDTLDPAKVKFSDFLMFYRHLIGRTEVDKVFADTGAKKKPYITAEQFMNFLNHEQRDPRLNEILYPNVSLKQAEELIDLFETKKGIAPKGHMSQEGFLKYLMSEENGIIPPDLLDLSQDMNQPLAHYFVNSSHNTYLTGHQFTSKSSVELYRQVLLAGCRCVELDCWDGNDEEPIITHGFTMCTEVPFKEVIEAIAESAFKTSDYPLILSFENHCSPKQQAKMAAHCRNIFGDMLLTELAEGFPLKPNVDLPCPEVLKYRIIVKNKKKHTHKAHPAPMDRKLSRKAGSVGQTMSNSSTGGGDMKDETVKTEEEDDNASDSDSNSDDEGNDQLTEEEERRRVRDRKEKGTAGSEAEAAMEMSALVNYVQPVHFHSFEMSEKRARSYEISSFVETQATALLKEFPPDFVNYNKRQLSRIYPRGTRVDSSNCMPQVYWNAGCQLVALNFQTLDLAMQLNLGIFEYNNCSGYVLKPDFMRRGDRHFDPFAESTVDGIVAGTVSVKVISGQLLTDKRVGTYVEVDMYGLPTDTVRKRFKTRTVPANGINPVYDDEPFVFKKVVLPNLAVIRFGVFEETGKFIGHRVLPVEGLRPGYRHISLRNDCNQPLLLPTLFVHISVRDYVPDAFADFAAALVNPIAHYEKHAQQLAVLTEDFDYSDEEEDEALEEGKCTNALEENVAVAGEPSNFEGRSDSRKRPSLSKRVNSEQSLVSDSDKSNPNPRVTRVGSTHGSLSKQESSSSNMSQGSGPANPITRMKSTVGSSSIENGSQSQTLLTSTRLNEPEMIAPTPLEELKLSKVYVKAVAKCTKDVDCLRRKHEKERAAQKELHELQQERFYGNQLKARVGLEKSHGKLMKKASKSGRMVDTQHQTHSQMGELLKEQEIQVKEMMKNQMDEVVSLHKDQFRSELEIHLRHHDAIFDAFKTGIEQNHVTHKKKLIEVHDWEVQELKRKMEVQTRDDMKALSKKHKDRQELSRIKRESQQKHITVAVQERQRMKDILEKRTNDLEKNLKGIWSEYESERQKGPAKLTEEFEERCRQCEDEMNSKAHTVTVNNENNSSDTNGINGIKEKTSL